MKKMFLASTIALLTLALSANARPQHRDYGDDNEESDQTDVSYEETSDELTSNSEESSTYEDVSYKDMDADKGGDDNQSSFLDEKLHYGVHVGLGFAGTWGNEEAAGLYFDPNYGPYLGVKDPYAGYMGVVVDMGFMLNYRLHEYISFAPEINVRVLGYFRESDCYYLHVPGEGDFPLDENMTMFYINVPLLARITPFNTFYAEVGAEVNLNVSSSFSLSNSDYEYEQDMGGTWKGQTIGFGLIIGGGKTIEFEGHYIDVGGRIVFDLSRIEADQMVDMSSTNGTYRNAVGTKSWGFQFVCNYYIK